MEPPFKPPGSGDARGDRGRPAALMDVGVAQAALTLSERRKQYITAFSKIQSFKYMN
ncbi:MAG: hypothetical protein QHC78_11335 [Pigmentiphaga sp.]|uniref:hypothetical protein n=1 Tax=Pigmentiphaga sp. TaxID=1977564 RepID=UPI0029B38B6A|nr:hypothetical protein [Pigmentiphaga sp.]MDX3906272.1 hypothetical protein [Pigmentiphaga sp.]